MLRTLCIAIALSTTAAAADPDPIRIKAGETKAIDVGEFTRLSISQPDVAAVSSTSVDGQLSITGRGVGKTTLQVWQKGGKRVTYLVDVRSDAPPKQEVRLSAGQKRTLKLQPFTRIALGDPSIADVRASGDGELEVAGISDGRTTMLVWLKDGTRAEYELAVSGGANATTPSVTVKIGEKRHVELHNVRKIALADPEIADIELGERQSLDIDGKREGKTALKVWYGDDQTRVDYEITVTR